MKHRSRSAAAHVIVSITISLLHGGVCLAQDGLAAELKRLTDKYGSESVARALERQQPTAVQSARVSRVPSDAIAATKSKTTTGFHGLLIRRSYSDVTLDEDPTLGAPRGAAPAKFSYSRDFVSDSDAWAALGAIIFPFSFSSQEAPSSSNLVLSRFALVPSISFEKITGSGRRQEIDSLIFRAGLVTEFAGGPEPLRLMQFRLNATYATDFSFDEEIVAAELDWEPTTSLPGNRTFYRLASNGTGNPGRAGSLIEFYWRVFLHAEGGHVVHPTREDNRDPDFFRAGPSMQLRLDPLMHQRLSFSAAYSHFARFVGDDAGSHHLRAALSFILDPDPATQHWTLDASYEDGHTPLADQRVRAFLVSFGIKY